VTTTSTIGSLTGDADDISRQPGVIVIEPTHGWAAIRLREVWQYRELLYYLIWRDLAVRYKHTIIGVLWAIINPVTSMIIFSVFLGGLVKVPSDGIPYPIFSFAALVPWGLFFNALDRVSGSLTANTNLVTKVYFPRLVIPISGALSSIIDFVMAFAVLLLLMVFYGYAPTINIIFLPFFMALALATGLGVGLWFAALNVRFRDVKYVIPFLVQAWMFATPIVYSSSLVTDSSLRVVYGLNPLTSVIEGFRWMLLNTHELSLPTVAVSTFFGLILLWSGVYYFRRTERSFADLL